MAVLSCIAAMATSFIVSSGPGAERPAPYPFNYIIPITQDHRINYAVDLHPEGLTRAGHGPPSEQRAASSEAHNRRERATEVTRSQLVGSRRVADLRYQRCGVCLENQGEGTRRCCNASQYADPEHPESSQFGLDQDPGRSEPGQLEVAPQISRFRLDRSGLQAQIRQSK